MSYSSLNHVQDPLPHIGYYGIEVQKANRFFLWKAHQSPPIKKKNKKNNQKNNLYSFLIPGCFSEFFFTSPILEAKRGFKSFCFTSGRWMQRQWALAGRGEAASAPVRPKKQVTWINRCAVLEVWNVSADWQSSVNLSSQGTWRRALVQLQCHPCWCQRLFSAPKASKMLSYLLDLKLHPSLWRRGLYRCREHSGKDQMSLARLRHKQQPCQL